MDPWTGRYLARARIDALLEEAASERLAATATRVRRGIGFVTDHDPDRCPLVAGQSPRFGDDGGELERSGAAEPSLWSISRQTVAGVPRPGR